MASTYTEVLVYIASLVSLESPTNNQLIYDHTRSCFVQKGEYLYQFYGRPFDKKVFCDFYLRTMIVLSGFRDGYVSKKRLRTAAFGSFVCIGLVGVLAPSLHGESIRNILVL